MNFPLTDVRALSYKRALDPEHFCFVAVLPSEEAPDVHGAMGLAIANERGYQPIPLGWAHYASLDTASDHADHLNKLIGLTREQAVSIQVSTMGGMRYEPAQD